MSTKNIRLEVMQFLEKNVDNYVDQFLIPVEKFGNQLILPNSE
jgi:acyl-[acyl-carrier-protein] desaturase